MKTEQFAAELHRAEFHLSPVSSGNYQIALHTSKPESAEQSENEVTLPGYARLEVARDTATWAVSGHLVSNATRLRFATITGGKATAKWLTLGLSGQIRRLIELEKPAALAENRALEFGIGEIKIEDQ